MMIFRLLVVVFSLLLLPSCSDNGSDDFNGRKEVSIAHLKSLCRGDHYRIVEDMVVRGVVIANDRLGEYHNSVVVVDRTSGVEISIESRNLSALLPIYSEVEILCSGLMLARIGGKIELGAPSTGDFPIGNISEEMLGRYIRVVGVCEDFTPVVKQFSEIGVEDISCVVRFENIRICDEERGLKWCDTDENGEVITTDRTFVDSKGDTFTLRTLATCHYAKEVVPTTEIAVIGVIDYADNRHFLRIVNKWIIPVFR